MKKLPQRTCIGCNTQKNKTEFIRIVKEKNGNISIDEKGKKEGRGAYICENTECLSKAVKSKRLEKTFKSRIEKEIYCKLKEMMDNK